MNVHRPAFVYVIGSKLGPQKIGLSNNPERRALALTSFRGDRIAVLFKLHRPNGDARRLERTAHHLLRDNHYSGEWFDVSIDDAIRAVNTAATIVSDGTSLIPLDIHQFPVKVYSGPDGRVCRRATTSFRLKPDVLNLLIGLAAREGISLTEMVERLTVERAKEGKLVGTDWQPKAIRRGPRLRQAG